MLRLNTLRPSYPLISELELEYEAMLDNRYKLKKSDMIALSEGRVTERMYTWMLSEKKRLNV